MAEASARPGPDPAVLSSRPEGANPWAFGFRPVGLGLTAVFLVGFAAWVVAVDRLPADYDEVYHAHAIWLIAQGDRPFHDFLAVHTPFLWYATSSVTSWLPDSPQMLLPLRISAGIGSLIWIAALIANLGCDRSNLSTQWMLAGLGVALFSTPVLAYVVEFRPDSWAFALYFCALFEFRRRGPATASIRQYACFACLATAAVVASLKVAPFAVMFAFFDLLRLIRRGRELHPALVGHAIGVSIALVLSWLWLKWMQLDVRLVFQFACQYQALFESKTGFSHGLARSILANPLPLLVGSAGILAWGVQAIMTRSAPAPFQASVVTVLVWELLDVHRPYKQYYGPWLLMAAPFFAYIEPFCKLRGLRDGLFGSAVAVGGLAAAVSVALLWANELGPSIQVMQEQLAARSREDSRIIAPPPFHPITRRDVFYAWSRTTDPHGYATERVLSDLGYGDLVSAERYRCELGRGDPSVIVLPLPGEELYEPLQWQIISEFLRRSAQRYDIVKSGHIRQFAVKRAPTGSP